jgi:dipeptidyl aminopeptidase/acylaminoacyl peptidase
MRKLIAQDGPDSSPVWSPDGTLIAFQTSMANPAFYYVNSRIAVSPSGGGTPTVLTAAFDEDPNLVEWLPNGLYFLGRRAHVLASLSTRRGDESDRQGHIRRASRQFELLVHEGRRHLRISAIGCEIDVRGVRSVRLQPDLAAKTSDMNAQTAGWTTSTLEVVSWKSQDGATIEGVLHKPLDFDPSRKYPLLVVIHGGRPACRAPCRSRARSIRSMSGCRAECWSSNRTIAAAPATVKSSVR